MKHAGLIIIALLAVAAGLAGGASPTHAAATFVVNSTGDASDSNTTQNTDCDTGNLNSGGQPECTLRAAIEQANAPNSGGLDTIDFDIPTTDPGYDGPGADAVCTGNVDDEGDGFVNDGCPQVGGESETDLECTNQIDDGVTFIITPNTFMDFINDPVTINGRTQLPQFVDKPVIQLNGSNAGNFADGLRITAGGGGSTVSGLVINRFGGITGNGSDGIEIQGGGNNTIEGNFIGVDSTGILTDTNLLVVGQVYGNRGSGVFINGSANNTVGGARPGTSCVGATNPCNILSGGGRDESAFSDAHGVEISGNGATGNVIKGNIIGLDIGAGESGPLCAADLGPFLGGTADDDSDTVVNDGCPALGFAENDPSNPCVGIDPDCTNGTTCSLIPIPNNSDDDADGVINDGCPAIIGATKDLGNRGDGVNVSGAASNTIGGGAAGEGNVITANNGNGVQFIGGPEAGSACTNNTDNDGDGAFNDGCPQVGDAAESGAGCANSTDDDQGDAGENHSANGGIGWVNDGCPAVRVASGNQLEGNLIGTTSPGTSLPPPGSTKSGNGVLIDGAPSNIVGVAGGVPNIVSGNGGGIQIQGLGATLNVVQRNFVGTDVAGGFDLGNQFSGIALGNPVAGASNNTIGGTTAGSRNVVSGNDQNGIDISNSASTGNLVRGNYVGTNAAGTAAIGNGFPGGSTVGRGVRVKDSSGNTIGGTAAGRNVISGNITFGVEIAGSTASGNLVQSNYIGTNSAGTGPVGNLVGGIIVSGAPNSTIGGTTADVRNVISGNGPANAAGILISGTGATGTLVQGNLIGTNFDGTASLGNGGSGVLISGGPGNTVGGTSGAATRNIISGNSLHGVEIDFTGGTGNLVRGNYIGLNINGNPLGNGGDGLFISDAPANTVGGTAAGAGNAISDNGAMGVHIAGSAASANVVQGNVIGTDAAGAADVGNGSNGVFIDGAPGNVIGGMSTAARNVISGNDTGVFISTQTATGNLVRGNRIGTNAAGTGNLGNTFDGVRISDASANFVGGAAPGAGNTIAFNGALGVVANSAAAANSILSNSIFENGELGIDLAGGTENANGVTANDAQDADTGGPNELQNYPIVTSATGYLYRTTVVGTFNSAPNQTFTLQFFASPVCDGSGFGEGKAYLGSFPVVTNGSGDVSGGFNQTLLTGGAGNQQITATATDQFGNTSEFSGCHVATPNPDWDGDTIADVIDNCPFVPNTNQTNTDNAGDGGDACDLDDDNDKVYDVAEQNCGSDPLNLAKRPERTDLLSDDDGDGQFNEALPPGAANYDCDGDGFIGSREAPIGTSDQDPCGANGWPADFDNNNSLGLADLASFIAPTRHLGTSSGEAGFSARWDIVPGSTFGASINIQDMAALITGASGYPPMFGGARAFGQTCPWSP